MFVTFRSMHFLTCTIDLLYSHQEPRRTSLAGKTGSIILQRYGCCMERSRDRLSASLAGT